MYGTQLYHQTDEATAEIILKTQEMKPGKKGLAGGGIYFATTEELTGHKALHKGVILRAYVRLGRIKTLDHDGDTRMTLAKLRSEGFDSVCIARKVSSGHEYVVYDPAQVLYIEPFRPLRSRSPSTDSSASTRSGSSSSGSRRRRSSHGSRRRRSRHGSARRRNKHGSKKRPSPSPGPSSKKEEAVFCVGPIWSNDEAPRKANAWIKANKPSEGWEWTGHWWSEGGTSYCQYKR